MPKAISVVAGKNVSLVGFDKLDTFELKNVKEVMSVWIPRIEERTDYQELKIRLKQHQRAQLFLHELEAELFIPGQVLGAKVQDKSLARGLAKVCSKLVQEICKLKKKSVREHPIRKLTE